MNSQNVPSPHCTLVIAGSVLESNWATGDGGGIANDAQPLDVVGPNLDDASLLFVLGCQLLDNVAPNGGGVANDGGSLLAIGSTFARNHAVQGGGIRNWSSAGVLNCAFDFNGATNGGAIWNSDAANGQAGTITITNSSLSNNSANSGGAIWNLFGGTVTVESCTLSNNSAAAGDAAIYNDKSATLNLGNCLLQNNTPGNLKNLGTHNDLGGNVFQ
jgi:hypothetical protein